MIYRDYYTIEQIIFHGFLQAANNTLIYFRIYNIHENSDFSISVYDLQLDQRLQDILLFKDHDQVSDNLLLQFKDMK